MIVFKFPIRYISDQVVRNTPNLREKFDVIIFPPLGGSAQSIVNGIPMRGDAIPWKESELTPNMGLSPDQADDIRGGMGLAGVVNLQKFVRDGGLFITVANTAQLPIDFGITTGVSIQEPRLLQARGSIFNARLQQSGFLDRHAGSIRTRSWVVLATVMKRPPSRTNFCRFATPGKPMPRMSSRLIG